MTTTPDTNTPAPETQPEEQQLPDWYDGLGKQMDDALRQHDKDHAAAPKRFGPGEGVRDVIDDKHLDFDEPEPTKEGVASGQ